VNKFDTESIGGGKKEDKKKRTSSPLAEMQRYCSLREYCIQDIRIKLKNRGCPEDEVAMILERLIKEKFLSEERYANAFVRDKSSLSGWGGRKIEYALRNKGVAPEAIKSALAILTSGSESRVLEKVIQRKIGEFKFKGNESNEDRAKIKDKLLRFALSRGFSFEEILKVINKTMANFGQ